MTKEVLIHIKSIHFLEGPAVEDNEALEVLTTGEYYYRNKTHYLLYDEMMEGTQDVTHTMVKIRPGLMEVRKRGVVNVHMLFEDNKKNMTIYKTPVGNLEMEISATKVLMAESRDALEIRAEYAMEMNRSEAFDCRMDIRVTAKGDKQGSVFFR